MLGLALAFDENITMQLCFYHTMEINNLYRVTNVQNLASESQSWYLYNEKNKHNFSTYIIQENCWPFVSRLNFVMEA